MLVEQPLLEPWVDKKATRVQSGQEEVAMTKMATQVLVERFARVPSILMGQAL